MEDEEQVRDLARRVLERVGYTVLAAADAESATAIADRHARPHPPAGRPTWCCRSSGGRELAARLSIHRPAIKVLYISGTSDASIARLRLLEPGTAFLEKPFSLDRLLRTVRQALDDPDKGRPPGVSRPSRAPQQPSLTRAADAYPGAVRAQPDADVGLRQRDARPSWR